MFIEKLGWRQTLLVLAGIVLNCAVFGAFFRPLKPIIRAISPSELSHSSVYFMEYFLAILNISDFLYINVFSQLSSHIYFIPDEKEIESLQNAQTNGAGIKPKSRVPSMRVPSVTAIAEIQDAQMTRSQSYSVGHGMRAPHYNDKTDDVRYMLSQPLLADGMKPLARRRSSGTLSRPDIFYQV